MLSQRSSSGCKNRWAGLLRDGPSQRNYRGAVSSYGPYAEFRIMPSADPGHINFEPFLGVFIGIKKGYSGGPGRDLRSSDSVRKQTTRPFK